MPKRPQDWEWEEKLRAVEQVEQEYQTWRQQHRLELTAADRQDILSLGQDLPKLWRATGTTPADRKRIVRLIIKEVIVPEEVLRMGRTPEK